MKSVCTICGYTYDSETGEETYDVLPGTAFEDLPDSFVCPVCGATKDKFVSA